jgi:hypothetical protein
MMRLLRVALTTLVVGLTAIGVAYAATYVAAPSFGGKFYAAGSCTPFSGRTDCLAVDNTYKVPWLVSAGHPQSLGAVGFSYFEDFAYGDGDGLDTMQWDTTVYDSTALAINIAKFASGNVLAYWANVQEDIDIDMDATGLDIGGDQTANDGFTLMGGRYGASGRGLSCGDDPAAKFCVTVQSSDIDGSDRFFAGWVEKDSNASVPAAAIGTYLDFAGLGWVTAADPAVIQTQTSDGGSETNTSLSATTPALTVDDDTDVELCTLLSAACAVTYTVDDQTDADAPAYTFPDGAILYPTVFYLQDTGLADALYLTGWEVSFQ